MPASKPAKRWSSMAPQATKDIDYVKALGADKVVDYHTQRFEDEVRDADAVLDFVGAKRRHVRFWFFAGAAN
jgi:NADPH:quinone reductase-like Zn-dependent oxidoreductase